MFVGSVDTLGLVLVLVVLGFVGLVLGFVGLVLGFVSLPFPAFLDFVPWLVAVKTSHLDVVVAVAAALAVVGRLMPKLTYDDSVWRSACAEATG